MIGAGVVVRGLPDVTVLTAAHLLKESANPVVSSPDGLQFEVRSIERIPGHDLALIHVAPPPATFRVAVRGRPVAGESLAVLGHPRGKGYVMARGMVLDIDPQIAIVPDQGFIIACPSCDLGDSGAGVWDDRGVLVGILVAAIVNADGHKLGVWTVESIIDAR
jgi:S1-C subfamily serine protease